MVAVVLVYGLSMVLLIGSLAKRKMGDKNMEMDETQVHKCVCILPFIYAFVFSYADVVLTRLLHIYFNIHIF